MIGIVRLASTWLFLVTLLSCGVLAAEPTKEEDPFDGPPVGPKPSVWKNVADAKENSRGIRMLALIPDPDQAVVHAPGESPFVAIAEDVYDVVQGKVIGKAPRKKVHNTYGQALALSPNGQFFAYEHENEKKEFSIRVIDTKTGIVKHDFKSPADPLGRTIHLSFTKNNHLAAVTRVESKTRTRMMNMETGKVLKTFDIAERLELERIAFNRSGQYMATVFSVASRLVVVDVVQGKPVAQMAFPASEAKTSSFTNIRALAFSADGSELAGLFQGEGCRVVVWNANGKIVEDYPLGLTVMKTYPSIRFSPEGKALLVNEDYLLDRKLKAVAWICKAPSFHPYFAHRFLDGEHLLATRGDFQNAELISVRIPRQGIDAAALALSAGGNALLKPGDTIRLQMEVGATYVDGKSVSQELQKNIGERLAVGGLKVGDESDLTLQVKYYETAGKQLRVIESSGLGRPGFDTGQRVRESVGLIEAKLVSKSTGKVLWETKRDMGNPYLVEAEVVTDALIRDKMFEMIGHIIKSMSFPYYISADPKAPALPINLGDLDTVGK